MGHQCRYFMTGLRYERQLSNHFGLFTGETFEWNLFYAGADIPYIFNKNGLFPTTLETFDVFAWDYSVASGSTGTDEQNFSIFGVTNYVSATDYQINKNDGKCVYELITPKDSDVHAADGPTQE